MLYNENTAIVKNNNLEILVEEYKISQIATETSLKRQISKWRNTKQIASYKHS